MDAQIKSLKKVIAKKIVESSKIWDCPDLESIEWSQEWSKVRQQFTFVLALDRVRINGLTTEEMNHRLFMIRNRVVRWLSSLDAEDLQFAFGAGVVRLFRKRGCVAYKIT